MTQNSTPSTVDFTTLVLSISSAAYMGLGVISSTSTNNENGIENLKANVNLEMARHNIDLLELLSDKTKGNLTSDEAKLLSHLLFETRMKFIELQKEKNV